MNPTYPHPPLWGLTVLRCAYTLFHSNEELISRTMETFYIRPDYRRKMLQLLYKNKSRTVYHYLKLLNRVKLLNRAKKVAC